MKKINWNLIKTTYVLATLLKNQRFNSKSKKANRILFERILNIVINELDLYRVKFCRTEMRADINVSYSGTENQSNDIELFYNFMQNYFPKRYIELQGVIISKLDHYIHAISFVEYIQIDFLYDNFVKGSKIISMYKEVVQVYWNRRLQSIDTVFTDLMVTTFNSQNVYALYDIYNKFYLAVIFHEFKRVLVGDNYEVLTGELAKLKEEFDYNKCENAFPNELTSFTTDLNAIFNFTEKQDKSEAVKALQKGLSDVAEKFEKYNFIIRNKAQCSRCLPLRRFQRKGPSKIAVLYNEVNELVRNINHEFTKLKRLNV